MFRPNLFSWLKNIPKLKVLAFLLILAQFNVFLHVLAVPEIRNLSFDSAVKVVEKGAFNEFRETNDGNLIERLFLEIKGISYVDYLVLIDNIGKRVFIPIRDGVLFWQNENKSLGDYFIFNKNDFSFSSETNLLVSLIILTIFTVSLFSSFHNHKSGFLLFLALSRDRRCVLSLSSIKNNKQFN